MRKVAVTGATGYVGRFVVASLLRQGLQVRALARPQSDRGGFAAPLEWVTGDLRDAHARAALVQDADAVVHLAYEHVPGRYRGGEGDNLPGWLLANLGGSLELVWAAQAAGVARFVFLSSRAVFGRTLPGRQLDEGHPPTPDAHYGAYKAAVEAFLQSAAVVSSLKTCSIRATGVYGLSWPVERSKWWGLAAGVVCGEEIISSGGGTEVHGDDVAAVILHWLTHPAPPADIIHLSDLYVTHREVVRLAREISGRAGPLPPEPPQPPQNLLVCRRLEEMGLHLGGRAALHATVTALVQAAGASVLAHNPANSPA